MNILLIIFYDTNEKIIVRRVAPKYAKTRKIYETQA